MVRLDLPDWASASGTEANLTDSGRIALYLRNIVGELAEARGTLAVENDSETAEILDACMQKLRVIADTMDAADG